MKFLLNFVWAFAIITYFILMVGGTIILLANDYYLGGVILFATMGATAFATAKHLSIG